MRTMAPLSVAFLSPLEEPLSAGPGVPGLPILAVLVTVVVTVLTVSLSLTSFLTPPQLAGVSGPDLI